MNPVTTPIQPPGQWDISRLYSLEEAAAYVGLAVSSLRYHLYKSHRLRPTVKIYNRLWFSREDLDAFQTTPRKRGPPPRPRPDPEDPAA